jgi:spermidine synthase
MKSSPNTDALRLALLSLAFPEYVTAMSLPGIEIHRVYDEYGPIRVFEDGPLRYLAFSEDSQQSALNLNDPGTPVFHYIQAMLLSLLYEPSPKHVTLLGLGGGSLVHSLRRYDPALEIAVVELRQQVHSVARHYFALPDDSLVQVHIDDANLYMQQNRQISDLILTDIYSDDGMNEIQLSIPFLEHCFRSLSDSGILVFNLWDQGKGTHPRAKQALGEVFDGNLLACPVEDGNLIVFAFKGGLPQINHRHLQPQVKRLSKKLAFPVSERLQAMKAL